MSEQQLPLVSIVIPCYNQARYLSQAIESALSQTHSNVEVVVVNDGSTDETAEVASRYPQVRYFAQSNRGVAEARNFGFDLSNGDFIQFLDADDRLTKEAIETHLRCFAVHPEAGLVVGEIEWIDEEGRWLGKGNAPLLESNHYEELLKINHVANTIAVLLKRSVLRKVGGFNGFFSPAEDYEMLLRAARAFPSAHHSMVVAQYRRHTTNTSRRGATMLRATNRVFVAEREKVKGYPQLEVALRKGEQNWRDFFGGVTIKEIWAYLRCGDLVEAAKSFAALMRYVRGRIFIIPWRYRHRGLTAARRRLRKMGSRLSRIPEAGGAAPARSSRSSDPRV